MGKTLGGLAGIVGLLFLAFWTGEYVFWSARFTQDISGHLKRAADANQPPLAKQELEVALKGIERWNLCTEQDRNYPNDCYTSVLWRTPDEDVSFWKKNIEQTLADLNELPVDADPLTVSNVLMKVRETLVDQSDGDLHVTKPDGVQVYPHNASLAWLGIAGLLFTMVGAAMVRVSD